MSNVNADTGTEVKPSAPPVSAPSESHTEKAESPKEKSASTEGKNESQRSALRRNFRASSATNVGEKSTKEGGITQVSSAGPARVETQSSASNAPSPVAAGVQTGSQRSFIAPPADMTAEEKAAFADPSNPEKAEILQRYHSRRALEQRNHFGQKTREISEQQRRYAGIAEAVAPLEKDYSEVGIGNLISNAVKWQRALTGPAKLAAAREFLQEYGVDITQLYDQNGQVRQELQQQQSPGYLTREDAEKLAEERAQKVFDRHRQSDLAMQNRAVVQKFIESKPLFRDPGTAQQLDAAMGPEVRAIMQANPSTSVADAMERAYNRVLREHPVFSSLASELTAKQEAETKHAQAEKALAASRSVIGSPGAGTPKQKYKNQRENLVANFRK